MKKTSILKQILFPVVTILVCLTALIIGVVLGIFSYFYKSEVDERNLNTSQYVAETVGKFLDGAYNVSEELSKNPVLLSGDEGAIRSSLEDCVKRNDYIELLYTVSLEGMQTARSSGKNGDRKNRWWFKLMMELKEAYISKSYYSVTTGHPCASIYIPIYRSGQSGMDSFLGVDLELSYLQKLIDAYRSKSSDRYSFIIDGEGCVVAHPEKRYIEELYNFKDMTREVAETDASGEAMKDAFGNIKTRQESFEVDQKFEDCLARLFAGKSGTGSAVVDGKNSFVAYAPVKLKGRSDSWGVVTVESTGSAFSLRNKIVFILMAIGIVSLIVANLILLVVAKTIATPIKEIVPVIKALAGGDFSERLSRSKTDNEVSDIVDAFNSVTEQLESSRNMERDLGKKLFLETQNLAVATKETAATSQDSSAAVKEIVATMEDSNALSENISSKIKDVSLVAQKTSSDVADGVARIEKNVEQLHAIFDANQKTIDGMKVLGEQIESIWDLVTLINSIADQAKIIAFNTELEVASAGAAGEPFRIVSNEIRRLSDGIIDGTKEIKEKITLIQKSSDSLIIASESGTEKINAGYQNAKELGEKFESIKSSSEITATSASDITEIIQQQAIGSEQILIALKQIAGGIENFSVATDNISSSAENLREISEELNKEMNSEKKNESEGAS